MKALWLNVMMAVMLGGQVPLPEPQAPPLPIPAQPPALDIPGLPAPEQKQETKTETPALPPLGQQDANKLEIPGLPSPAPAPKEPNNLPPLVQQEPLKQEIPGIPPPVQKDENKLPPLRQQEPLKQEMPGIPPPAQRDPNKPPPLIPASGVYQHGIGEPAQTDPTKPPPFRLLDSNPPADAHSPKLAPIPPSEALPPGTLATPCLVLLRSGPSNVNAGQVFSYEIVARNVGGVTAMQAKLEEELPPGTRFVSAQPMPMVQERRLSWSIDNLPPGAERRFRVEVEANMAGEWRANATLIASVSSVLRANVAGAPPQPAPLQQQPVPTQQAITMTSPVGVPVGHPAPFQIRVTNNTGATLSDAMVRVNLGPGLQHLHGDAIEGALGDLTPGQTRELTLDAITTQTGRLSAEVKLLGGKRVIGNAQASVLATEQPTLSLSQSGAQSPPPGSEQEYKLEVTNRSGGEVRDVRLNETLPEGLELVSADSNAQYDMASRTLRWSIGNLNAGQSRPVAFRVQVRGSGPQMNRASANAVGMSEVLLYTIIRIGGAQ